MPRVSRAAFVSYVNELIQEDAKAAAGSNRWLSRREEPSAPTLIKESSQAVRQQKGPGARVDVTEAASVAAKRVEQGLDTFNESSGPGHKLVSKEEVRALALRDAAAGVYGLKAYQILRNGGPVRATGAEIAAALQPLAKDLIFDDFGSEADARFEVVHFPGPGKKTQSAQDVADAVGFQTTDINRDTPIFQEGAAYLRKLVDDHKRYDQEFANSAWYQGPLAGRAQQLADLMIAGLTDIKIAIFGADDSSFGAQHPVYIVGTAADGSVVGIKSTVVWT